MRICQVIESCSGGSVQVALDLSQGLVQDGHEVVFVYSPVRADAAFFAAIPRCAGIAFVPLPMQRGLSPLDLLSLARLWLLIRKHGLFDVVHAHSSKAGGLVRLLRPLLPKTTRIVYTPHAFVTMAPDASCLYKYMERALGRFCDAIVPVSSGERDHAAQALGLDPAKLCVIPNGIDFVDSVTRAQARKTLGVAEDDLVVGFVGRFVPQKNVKRLIEAFALASKEEPRLRLMVVGGGPQQSMVQEALMVNGFQRKTRLWIDQPARPLIPGFDVLVCSSDYEGISLVFLEALTAGVPIVTTPVAGARETVEDGKTGFVASAFSSEALAQVLLRWCRLSSAECALMSAAAREKSKGFTRATMVAAYVALYQALRKKAGT